MIESSKVSPLILDEKSEQSDKTLDIADYSKKMFGMFGGKVIDVSLRCPIRKIGILLDRFGKDISIILLDDEFIKVRVQVVASEQFFGWLCAIGSDIMILKPDTIREDFKKYLKRILDNY